MDLQMPEMNGFEATDYIRNKMHSNIPIIALTADVTTVDLAKCKTVGMTDYIAKPVDEKLLFSKIIGLVKKPVQVINTKLEIELELIEIVDNKRIRCIDLKYLNTRTKSNPQLMMEMISLYLEQTPQLITSMNKGLADKDWALLQASVHKMIPSFSIMGISSDFEVMAKKVQEYASTLQQLDLMQDLVSQLGDVCRQACDELEVEFNRIKKDNE